MEINIPSINLPIFINVQFNISPGIISAVINIFWYFLIFIITYILQNYGYGYLIKNLNYENINLFKLYKNYLMVDSVLNFKIYNMIKYLKNKKVVILLIYWLILFIFKELFTLSIESTLSTDKNENNCIGSINDDYIINTKNFQVIDSVNYYSSNITQSKILINQRKLGNISMLGNGMFTSYIPETVLNFGDKVTVNKIGLECIINKYENAKRGTTTSDSFVLSNNINPFVNTTYFTNININDISISFTNVNVKLLNTTNINGETIDYKLLIGIYNPWSVLNNTDINYIVNNTNLFLSECYFTYQIGFITMLNTGYLNETNINNDYTIIEDKSYLLTLSQNNNTSILYHLVNDNTFLNIYDYPDIFLNSNYNKSYYETITYTNDIIASHLLNYINPYIDSCYITNYTMNTMKYTIGTKFSIGYLMIPLIISFFVIILMIIFTKINKKLINHLNIF